MTKFNRDEFWRLFRIQVEHSVDTVLEMAAVWGDDVAGGMFGAAWDDIVEKNIASHEKDGGVPAGDCMLEASFQVADIFLMLLNQSLNPIQKGNLSSDLVEVKDGLVW